MFSHITDGLEFGFYMLIGMVVGHLDWQTREAISPPQRIFQKKDIGSTFMISPPNPIHTIFRSIQHYSFSIWHVLYYKCLSIGLFKVTTYCPLHWFLSSTFFCCPISITLLLLFLKFHLSILHCMVLYVILFSSSKLKPDRKESMV